MSRSLGRGLLGKIVVTDDEGHRGIGWTREEADSALEQAREENREYVEYGIASISGTGFGDEIDKEDDEG